MNVSGHVNLTAGQVVGGRFLIEGRLGQGGFGSVYGALGLHTGRRCALKVERGGRNALLRELEVLSAVGGEGSVAPAPLEWWRLGNHSVLAMEAKGATVRGVNGSLAAVGVVMAGVLALLAELHGRGFVHRDVKASNIVRGYPDDPRDARRLYLVDFGLAERFRAPRGEHVPLREGVRPKGTFQYLSVRSHRQLLQSRRDDLESLAYMASVLLKGRLPWSFSSRRRPTHPKAARIKESRTHAVFSSCPRVFADFLQYARGLEYAAEPDYAAWRQAFLHLGARTDPHGVALHKCRMDVYRPHRRNTNTTRPILN
ncbi:casein kinase 1-like protein 6 [Portunus trituberculatus]|uniref:casein kinase 1-like protein 6 n=1 Tax=Portunus trituberculatus TaxID=210409 RepID=UPI001E1D2018|nr:casein kinase 1-like protein 6 [Portunus trituberculatus]